MSSTTNEADVAQEEKKVRKVRATTTEDRNTVTQERTTITTSGGESTTIISPKTEKAVVSENGFTSRKNFITERFVLSSAVEEITKIRKNFDRRINKYKLVDSIGSGIELKQTPLTFEYVTGVAYVNGERYNFNYDSEREPTRKGNILPVLADLDDDGKEIPNSKKVFFTKLGTGLDSRGRVGRNVAAGVSIRDIQILHITYTVLEKIDPNFKG